MNKNFEIVDYLVWHQKDPELYPIPLKEEIAKLKTNDFVFLILSQDEKEERLWVKIDKMTGKGKFEGIIANQPVILTDIKAGDKVVFSSKNIVNFSTEEEQQRIIDEFNKTGFIPTKDKKIPVEKIRDIIGEIIHFDERHKDSQNRLFKINKIDNVFFRSNLEEVANQYEMAKNRNLVTARILQNDIYKMFFSLVLVIVLPQISESIDTNEAAILDKDYLTELTVLLTKIADMYNTISRENVAILVEIRKFFEDKELESIEEQDLPDLFGAYITETIEDVNELK